MSDPTQDLVYSLDGENFRFDDLDELLAELDDEGNLVDGATFESGTAVRRNASEYFDISDITDQLGERAYEDAGEWSSDFPEFAPGKREELSSLVKAWLDANVPVTFWSVRDTKTVEVTQQMIDQFKGHAA